MLWPPLPTPPTPDLKQSLTVQLPDQDNTDHTASSALWVHICKLAAPLQQSAQGSTKQRKANTEASCQARHALNTQCCY